MVDNNMDNNMDNNIIHFLHELRQKVTPLAVNKHHTLVRVTVNQEQISGDRTARLDVLINDLIIGLHIDDRDLQDMDALLLIAYDHVHSELQNRPDKEEQDLKQIKTLIEQYKRNYHKEFTTTDDTIKKPEYKDEPKKAPGWDASSWRG